MHIPDGYISPSTSAVAFAAVTPFWIIAGRRARAALKAAAVPRLGLFAAFTFVLMMFNIPLVGGTSGHAVGGALMALALGPWIATLGISAALVIQAVMFGDGGIQAIGANCLIIGVILPFAAWGAFRALRRGRLSEAWAAGLGGWFGMMAAALAVAVVVGVQPIWFHAADGAPLYSPYGLKTALWAMIPSHALIVAPAEGLITGLVWAYLRRARPALSSASTVEPGGRALWPAWAALFLLALLTPIGLLVEGEAWGEWGGEALREMLGYVPAGLARLEAARPAAWLPDYTVPGLSEPLGYVVAALLGMALAAALAWGVVTLARGGRKAAENRADAP